MSINIEINGEDLDNSDDEIKNKDLLIIDERLIKYYK
jgi:hypothetical protein